MSTHNVIGMLRMCTREEIKIRFADNFTVILPSDSQESFYENQRESKQKKNKNPRSLAPSYYKIYFIIE